MNARKNQKAFQLCEYAWWNLYGVIEKGTEECEWVKKHNQTLHELAARPNPYETGYVEQINYCAEVEILKQITNRLTA